MPVELQKYLARLNIEVNHQWNYKNTVLYILNIEVDHQWNYKNTLLKYFTLLCFNREIQTALLSLTPVYIKAKYRNVPSVMQCPLRNKSLTLIQFPPWHYGGKLLVPYCSLKQSLEKALAQTDSD